MVKRNPKQEKQAEIQREYEKFDLGNASSAHECTGLIPTPPQTDEEMESYMAIFDYRAPDAVSEEEEKIAEKTK